MSAAAEFLCGGCGMHHDLEDDDHTVPRRAAFDDLRVGMVIARVGEDYAFAGTITDIDVATNTRTAYATDENSGIDFTTIPRNCQAGEVTILRDTAAPPVTVRREDYDALVRAYSKHERNFDPPTGLFAAASDLIDNATTGAPT